MATLEDLPKELVRDPYQYIPRFYEDRYPNAGGKIFSYASLVGISSRLPDITKPDGTKAKTNLHVLMMAGSGAGKTEMLKEIEKWAYNGWFASYVTPAKFEEKSSTLNTLTLLVNDLKRSLDTQGFIKAYEQAVDGFIKREVSGNSQSTEVDMSSIGCAVPQDIANSEKLYNGFLPRMIPVYYSYDIEEQQEIGERIAEGYYQTNGSQITDADIVRFYQLLKDIQSGETDHPRVENFEFSQELGDRIFDAWKSKVDEFGSRNKYFFRDLEYGFAFSANIAFLNYFNREVDDRTMIVEEQDVEYGIKLMNEEMPDKNLIMSNRDAVEALVQKYGD